MNKNFENIAAWLLGAMMIIFGLNKFMGFIAVEPPSDATAQAFMGAMFTSYLYVVVGLVEIIGGALLIIPRLRFLGWLLLAPIVFNIVAFHLAHDFIGNGIWLVPTAIFLILGYFQAPHLYSLTSNKSNHATA